MFSLSERFLTGAFLFLLIFAVVGCEVNDEENNQQDPDFLENLESYTMVFPDTDTLFLSDKSSPIEVLVNGRFIEEITGEVTHQGLFHERRIIITSRDTTFDRVPGNLMTWSSSNSSIAGVANGIVTVKKAGNALISGYAKNLQPVSFIVSIQATPVAPWISVNNPDFQLVFQKPLTISGTTEIRNSGSWKPQVTLTNKQVQTASVSTGGSWSIPFSDLSQGINIVEIKAADPDRPTLFSSKTRNITYLEIGTPDADKILGTWRGTYGSVPLRFEVVKNSLIPGLRYDINLHIDIDLLFVGYVSDVNLPGFIDHEGQIDVNGSVKIEGFTLQVTMNGQFRDTGKADGTMKLRLSRSGFPTTTSTENWVATKSE